MVSAQSFSPNCSKSQVWKEILINSFVETRFQNVLKRATLLQQTSWFWHRECSTKLCDRALAIIACSINDYRQLLIKQNQLANTVIELDPEAELLLLISPLQDFVFGTVLSTLESFCTHILFTQNKQQSFQSGDRWRRWGTEQLAINNSVSSTASKVFKSEVTQLNNHNLARCENNRSFVRSSLSTRTTRNGGK
ncbi:hypothetical protein A6770_38210 [Nostoc minutum NIES-26]|uniref:Uncharacterized protein n=1 Tax=Nostoc minutum NIES-26 TaxID=1844469 RepID=A0A367RWQ1_9NOSO|nr:hypothetical protein A6770_38210 [Nostoc minutum NIES-26]